MEFKSPFFRRLARTVPTLFDITPEGERFPIPFRMQGRGVILYFTAPKENALRVVGDSGYHPILTTEGKAVGMLYLFSYDKTDLGPYHEAIISFPCSRTERTVRARNALTPLAASLGRDVVVFNGPLLLDNDAAIQAGRQAGDFDKSRANISMRAQESGFSFDIRQQDGTPVLSGAVQRPSALDGLGSGLQLAANLGVGTLMDQRVQQRVGRLAGKLEVLPMVNRRLDDPAKLTDVKMFHEMDPKPKAFEKGDRVKSNPATPFGSLLAGARFQSAAYCDAIQLALVRKDHPGQQKSPRGTLPSP